MNGTHTMELSLDLTGRTAIVTGAARGIGRALAEYLAGAKADVLAVDVDEEALTDVGAVERVSILATDPSVGDNAERVATTAIELTGRLDILVNNAGILRDRMLWKLTDDDWDDVLQVHLGASFRLIRAAVPHFRQQSYGRVVNVTSYSGIRGNVGQANYATAKAGVIGLTKTAAREVAGFGVTVNAISPNARTAMVESVPPDRLAELTAQIPVGRFADPAEICPAVGFLASEQAGYITGVVLPVDGGLSM